jgi:hypothetical protein
MSIKIKRNTVEKRNIKMKKIKGVIYDVFIGTLGIAIAVILFPIAFPLAVYKSIINSKRTKNGKK